MRVSTISLAITRPSGGGFTADDLANGTLVLNFVDPPPKTLEINFTNGSNQQWESDSTSTLAGQIGYYQIRG